jgi:hypothetical protein
MSDLIITFGENESYFSYPLGHMLDPVLGQGVEFFGSI